MWRVAGVEIARPDICCRLGHFPDHPDGHPDGRSGGCGIPGGCYGRGTWREPDAPLGAVSIRAFATALANRPPPGGEAWLLRSIGVSRAARRIVWPVTADKQEAVSGLDILRGPNA